MNLQHCKKNICKVSITLQKLCLQNVTMQITTNYIKKNEKYNKSVEQKTKDLIAKIIHLHMTISHKFIFGIIAKT